MALNPNVITLGIGPSSDIAHLMWFGLSKGAGVVTVLTNPVFVSSGLTVREAGMLARGPGWQVREAEFRSRS